MYIKSKDIRKGAFCPAVALYLFCIGFCAITWVLPGRDSAAKDKGDDASFTLNKIETGLETIERARLSGDGKKIICQSGTTIYQMNSDGSDSPLKVVDLPQWTYLGNINYNASKALVTSGTDAYILDIATGSQTEISLCVSGPNPGSSDNDRCLSPSSAVLSGNGDYVFFLSNSPWDCVYTNGWSCTKDGNYRRLWSIPADNPTNPDKVDSVFDPKAEWGVAAYGENFNSLLADHSGGVAFAYLTYKVNTDGTSGPAVGGIYISRNAVLEKVYDYEGTSSVTSLSLFSPDGKWLVCERGNTVYIFNTEEKSETEVVSRVFDANQESAQVYGISEDGQWLLFWKFFDKKKNTTYQYALVSRDATKVIPVIPGFDSSFTRGAGNPVSYDGNTVLFQDSDPAHGGDFYVAKKKGQCSDESEDRKDLRATKDYEGLPKETKEIMKDDCLTDEEKRDKITNLVKGWLDEYHISVSDLKNYIIPSIVVTKDLENGYKIFESLPNSKGTSTTKVTPYFRTLADALRKRKLTSSFVDKIDNYCRADDKTCEEVILRKALYICGTTISAPKDIKYFITTICKNIEGDQGTTHSSEILELAEQTRGAAFGSPAYDLFAFIIEGIVELIPIGKIITVLKKGYSLFGSASELYSDMTADDVKGSTYTYFSKIDKKDYSVVAAVMNVPNAAKVQILISRGQEDTGAFKADGYGIFLNLPLSINTGGSNDSPEHLVFDYNEKTDIYKKAKKYLKSFEEKGYTSPKRIDYFDYDSDMYNSVIELKP